MTVLNALVEGASVRSVERITGVHRDTITRLVVRVGRSCHEVMDVLMRDLPCQRIEVDEMWGFVGKKESQVTDDDDHREVGDIWLWVALDPDTKAVPTFHVGKHFGADAHAFVQDLGWRLTNRVQLSSDALPHYLEAVEAGFAGRVDWATVVKSYESENMGSGRYSPPRRVVAMDKRAVIGTPDMALANTSYVERLHLTTRMQMRRFTRLTNGFSKKRENLEAATALHFCWYNFVRSHRSIGTTPAIALGVTNRTVAHGRACGPCIVSRNCEKRGGGGHGRRAKGTVTYGRHGF